MVKKLAKYEIYAYSRTMLPMFIILLGVGLLTRFVQLFENNTTAYSIVNGSSIVALVVSVIVCLVMTVFVAISRYYKNLFSREGYLSFTLPVTPSQHIFTKCSIAVLFFIIGAVLSGLAIVIATEKEVLTEIFKAAAYIIKKVTAVVPAKHYVFYIIEAFVLVITSLACELLLFYACMTIGQLARKNRILLSFGVYFIYYFITQILGTIFIIVFAVFSERIVEVVGKFVAKHSFASIHLGLIGAILLTVILGTVYYIIIHYIMSKKLNLE